MRKVIENLFYQVIFQIAKIAIPLISVPIVSRALGPTGVGLYNYSNSIAQYFVILSGLGISLYGNREISRSRDSQIKMSKTFWDLVALKFLTTSILIFCYFFFISYLENPIIYIVQGITIYAVIFDISWFFMGIEDFKKVTMTSLLFQILGLVFIIILIKNENDTLKYIFIQSMSLFLSQVFTWIFLIKKIKFVFPSARNVFFHFKKSLAYLIPQVSVLFYTNLNKTILGVYTGNQEVAYYSNAQTINTMVIMMITTLDTVLLPKMSYLSSKNNSKGILGIMMKSIHLQLYVSIGAVFGLIAISKSMVPWFFGDEFLILKSIIPMFAPLLAIVPLGMAISRQYLLPIGEIKKYNYSVILGAVISICISLFTINFLGIYAAILATIISELFVTVSRGISFVRKEKFKFDIKLISKLFFSGVVMLFSINYFTKFLNLAPNPITTILQVILGIIIYFCVTFIIGASPLKIWKEK
ncbi:oligosaccharide flippase family protein [Enterococcus gallinarum]|uniref:oligosaccharide flippase family protein n=1 Tax=Enterococcus TaxID=1350 RepID=UPI003F75E48C